MQEAGQAARGIFSEQTLAGLADGIPAHPSTATQLPAMARADLTDDLPDDLPAEPLVFWSSTMLANLPEQTPQVRSVARTCMITCVLAFLRKP